MLEFPDPGPVAPDVETGTTGPGYRLDTWRFDGSAGDRVAADLTVPTEMAAWGILVVGHGFSSDRTADYIRLAAVEWAARGLVVAAADAPRHGERGTGQLPDLAEVGQPAVLVESVRDQRRLISTMGETRGLAGLPVAYLGFSMGTVTGVPLVAADARIGAALFTIGGSTRVLVEELFPHMLAVAEPVLAVTDPVVYARGMGGRPVLQMNARHDTIFSERSALALYDAFPEPKTLHFFDGEHASWVDGAAQYRRMYRFIERHLRG